MKPQIDIDGGRAGLLEWIILAAAVVFSIALRIKLLALPLERDEGEFAYVAQLMFDGVPPFLRAYSMKLPGTAACYSVIMALFGETPAGIHTGLLVVNLLTIASIFFLAKRLFGSLAGAIAAASFAVLSANVHLYGFMAHATHFMNLFVVLGFLVLFRAIESGKSILIFAAGLLFGLAVLMKQPAALFAAFSVLILIRKLSRPGPAARGAIAKKTAAFIAGIALPYCATSFLLYEADVFDRFWFWTVTYAAVYNSLVAPGDAFSIFRDRISSGVGPYRPLWILGILSFFAAWADRRARKHAAFLFAFLFASFVASCMGFYFRVHYFLLLLPPIAIAIGAAVDASARRLRKWGLGAAAAAPALVVALAAFISAYSDTSTIFRRSVDEISHAIYAGSPFAESIEIGRYIKAHSKEDDAIAVLGSEPQIYFYSHRKSATGYIYMYSLMEWQPWAVDMQQEMMREVEEANPKFVVLVQIPVFSWLIYPQEGMTLMEWMARFMNERYDLVGVTTISNEGSRYYWNEEAGKHLDAPVPRILVFRRKSI